MVKNTTQKRRTIARINKLRRQLEIMLLENDREVDSRVLELSQKLDVLILDYYKS